MAGPLRTTYEAMPDPRVVVAVGTDAISGGMVSPTYATRGGVGDLVPVDVWVPGSPPSPFSILHGILLAVGPHPGSERGVSETGLLLVALVLMGRWGGCRARLGERARVGRAGRAAPRRGIASAPGDQYRALLCVSGPALTVHLGDLLDFGQTALRLDPLAGLFLTLTGGLGVVISSGSAELDRPGRPGRRAGDRDRCGIAPGYMLLLASVTVTIVAADAFSFLFAWEVPDRRRSTS